MVAVSVSGHGVVFQVPVSPARLTPGDICELDEPDFYWLVTKITLDGVGRFRVGFLPVLDGGTRPYGERLETMRHNEFVYVMKADRDADERVQGREGSRAL